MSNDRSADALAALAAFSVARTLYPTAAALVEYLLDHTDDEIRADAVRSLESAARARERLRAAAAARLGENSAEARERIEQLEAELAAACRQADDSAAAAHQRETDLQAAVEALRSQLHEVESGLQQDLNGLRAELESAHHDLEQRERELAESNDERHRIQLKLDAYDGLIQDGRAVAAEPADEGDGPPAATISGVIEVARTECKLVAIPDAAPREIDALDADEKSGDWAREIWKALRALDAYASQAEFFNGGFWEWCEHTNHPDRWQATPKKLAMKESDSVMQDGRLWRSRRFYVDSKIDPSGYIHMTAHLKISEGGGQHIPRVYFHDDSKGRTKKMHVGFIGPHRLVPNTQS